MNRVLCDGHSACVSLAYMKRMGKVASLWEAWIEIGIHR